mgnify:CR=1 FL=1|jgi:hypothetical protein
MKNETIRHIAMINSFNVMTSRSTITEVMEAGMGVFGHEVGGEVDTHEITRVLNYFEDKEMYEFCAELRGIIDLLDDQVPMCECEYPVFDHYGSTIECHLCNKPLVTEI